MKSNKKVYIIRAHALAFATEFQLLPCIFNLAVFNYILRYGNPGLVPMVIPTRARPTVPLSIIACLVKVIARTGSGYGRPWVGPL